MSMGAWILAAFGTCVVPGLIALELHTFHLFGGANDQFLDRRRNFDLWIGNFWSVARYLYGVLIGATAIPAWFLHRLLLPIHSGTAGLGSPLRCWNCSVTESRR